MIITLSENDIGAISQVLANAKYPHYFIALIVGSEVCSEICVGIEIKQNECKGSNSLCRKTVPKDNHFAFITSQI